MRAHQFRRVYLCVGSLILAILGAQYGSVQAAEADGGKPPNIVLILADDLGYADLGCYGGTVATPRLDRLAAEGMRFTQFYAGSTVCAPSRCVLMTGLHTGRARVRGNGAVNIASLHDGDVTIAEILKQANYATALCGKWGLGAEDANNEGRPNDQGFDFFFGYLNQTHAHNYYPDFLWRNAERAPLANVVTHKPKPNSPGGIATTKVAYSPDLMCDEAIRFVELHLDGPFFLYWPTILVHANNEARAASGNGTEVPDLGDFASRDWPDADKGFAAMVARLDADVGRLLDALDRLGIADNTLALFTSDNGPHHEGGQDTDRFRPAGPLRGFKRDLYEGGVRVPLIARWPKAVPAGTTSDHISYHGDMFATLAEVTSQSAPADLDSVSMLPTLTKSGDQQKRHEYLYWEFYEQGSKQAVRAGNWKAIRMPMFTGKTELYDLSSDLSEKNDVAARHPEIVQHLESMMDKAHVDDPNWKQ